MGDACCGPIDFSWGAWTPVLKECPPLGLPGSYSLTVTHFLLKEEGSTRRRVSKCARASSLGFVFVFLWLVLLSFLHFPLEPDFLELVSWGTRKA